MLRKNGVLGLDIVSTFKISAFGKTSKEKKLRIKYFVVQGSQGLESVWARTDI